MKKNNIVKKNLEFNDIIKKGKTYKNNLFLICVIPNNKKYNRYGIAVPKKLGNAVFRNKLKRQIKTIIDNNKIENKSNDYIIILKKTIINENFINKMKSILELFSKIK